MINGYNNYIPKCRVRQTGFNEYATVMCVIPIMVYSYGFLFNGTMVGRASDLITTLTYNFNWWVSVWCLPRAGPTMDQMLF